jgi:tetratricopeptide (TPR) repeat protein
MQQATEHEDETIGERLKRLRLARGLSQRQLAAPGVTYAYISRLEAGTRDPSVKALRKLAAKLDVSPNYLETGREIDDAEERELQLADAELVLRLGNREEAERRLRSVLERALAVGDTAHVARARLALGLAADDRGDHETAVAELTAALLLDSPSSVERLDVYATLGRAYSALGEPERAVALFERCLAEIEEVVPADSATATRYRIMLSYALSDAGQLAEAHQLLRGAIDDEAVEVDPQMRIRALWSLARLSEMQGRSRAALRYARRAIALLEATEDDMQAGRAYLLAAWIMNSSGDPAGARAQLARAEHVLGSSAAGDDAAMFKVESARAAVRLDESAAAIRLAREALTIVGDQYGAIRGSALWVLAEGLQKESQYELASESFATAVDVLSEHRRWREASEACLAWGKCLRDTGEHERALEVLEQASELALRLKQRDHDAGAAAGSAGTTARTGATPTA